MIPEPSLSPGIVTLVAVCIVILILMIWIGVKLWRGRE
jgi:hypothetical protein